MSYAPYMSGAVQENTFNNQMNGDRYHYNGGSGMISQNRPNFVQNTGFNPNAPSFQPRQSNRDQAFQNPSTAFGQQQPRAPRFDPFGYNNRNTQQATTNRVSPAYPPSGQTLYSSVASSNNYNNLQQSNRNQQPSAQFASQFHQLIQNKVGGNSSNLKQTSVLQDPFLDPEAYEVQQYEAMYDFGGTSGGSEPIMIPLSSELIEQMHQSPNKQALFEIQVGLEQLISEPDNFDAWSGPIRDRIFGKEITREDRNTIAWLITEMAILVENCQYNFAKLCQVLNESINGFVKDALMPQLLEFHVMSQNNPDYLTMDDRRNLLTFYAELYEKLKVNSLRIPELAQGIIEQITDFLAAPLSDPIAKTVIHALKLCGRHLDADRHDAVDQIFSTFHGMIASGSRSLSDNALALIKNVILARGNHWGMNSETSNALTSSASEAYDIVFYDPDGQPVILNDEEISFFEKCNRVEGGGSSQANGDENDEYEEEYERFLQQQAEETALRTAEKALEKLSVDEDDFTNTSTDSKK